MITGLTAKELRVIGCLIEKSITTPEQYPLSVNAVMLACNQKSNRDPVVDWDEASVLDVLQGLKHKRLVLEESGHGHRVVKYQHRFCNTEFSELQLSAQALGILCVLFLRGPQTPGELRTRTQRLCEFNDVAVVEQVLNEMMQHAMGALVERLPREPGKRESRYRHLFGEALEKVAVPNSTVPPPEARSSEHDDQRLAELEQAVNDLRTEVARLREDLDSLLS